MATTHNYKYSGNDHDDYSQRTTSSPTILACYNYIYNYNENSVEKNDWLQMQQQIIHYNNCCNCNLNTKYTWSQVTNYKLNCNVGKLIRITKLKHDANNDQNHNHVQITIIE